MTDEELLNSIVGIMAHDEGCVDSGIHDELLRDQCKQEIERRRSEDGDPLTKLFTAYVHKLTAPDSGGYTIEDAAHFIAYLGDQFDWDCR